MGKQSTVRCLVCARTYHADKSWGNPECSGCSVVDRMDLERSPFAALLNADLASACAYAVSAMANDAAAKTVMANSEYAPSVCGDSLICGASSTAVFGSQGAP